MQSFLRIVSQSIRDIQRTVSSHTNDFEVLDRCSIRLEGVMRQTLRIQGVFHDQEMDNLCENLISSMQVIFLLF